MAGLKLKNIEKKYDGEVIAVKNFNIEIKDKEFIVLVGPSGCGKSTLLRMIAGLEEISSGELYIGDRLVNNLPPKNRDIAMVFQSYALYPHMTVYKNLSFALELRKCSKDEIDKKVKETARILDIEHLLQRKPKALSGGQRQRVALGRAMVRQPEVFLFDEPLSNLDTKLRTTMRSEISKLHKKLDTTFIYVTHDQTEAMTMGDRIVVMKEGVIQQIDNPQKIYNEPSNIFVAGFIGSPQINLIKCTLIQKNLSFFIKLGGTIHKIPDALTTGTDVSKYVDREIIAGIRPEDIYSVSSNEENYIEGVIELKENLGSETYVYFNFMKERFIGKFDNSENNFSGNRIKVKFNMQKIHLFDIHTEKSIL